MQQTEEEMEHARWNFDATDTDIVVCRDKHDKGDKCEYERMHPEEVLQLLNQYRARILELDRLAALMVHNAADKGPA
ncbi:MAG: hypothetical protein WAO76_00430 [Georgfuchsia sp.]